ncbi:alpha/beta hydrolase family protein [Sandarakinorhabdus sp. DWP1-3-1]|uniref:alpha/beta hydrolase family protein n=1 Tax=Sandarakinorhabdus sp. DWP1-3-1 TaxID=2804627 RepID=UPI003CF274F9
MRRGWWLFLFGLALVVGGSWQAGRIQTAGGIDVRDVRFRSPAGTVMSALLYVPPNATTATPAPGILAVHGYINSRETQDGFAIEFARRGYVVLALDQTGHGYSGGAAFSEGFGGPAGLAWLRGLPMVDKANIGLEGHSMGGWTVLAAAAAMPDAYRAVVLEGSSTGKPFAADGTPAWPRNLALVFSSHDEFSKLMWDVDRAQDVAGSAKLQALFGTTAIEPGRIYGSIAAGTARRLTQPIAIHPGDHISHAAIGDALDWFGRTLEGGTPLPAGDQIWFGKEVATGIALVGFVGLLVGSFDLLLALPVFAALRRAPPPGLPRRDRRWWRQFALTALMPAVTFFPAFIAVTLMLPPSALLPQTVTTQVTVWALVNAGLTLLMARFGPPSSPRATPHWLRAALLALATAAIGYLALLAMAAWFTVDLRFWVVALKPLGLDRLRIALVYVVPITLAQVVTLGALARLAVATDGRLWRYGAAKLALTAGFLLLLVVDYGVLVGIGRLPTAFDPLTTVIAIQFVPILATIAAIGTFTWSRTGSAVPGGLLCGLLVTWYVVAGTATQVS